MAKKKILITSASGLGYPSLVAPLKGEFFIIGTASEKDAAGFAFVDKKFLVSPIEDKKYTQDLLSICMKERVDVLLPVNPKELMKVASDRGRFEEIGTRVLVSSLASLEVSEDKEKFFLFCEKNKIAFPEFIKVDNLSDFCVAVKKLGYPEKDVCFKPKISSGTRGFRVLSKKNNSENFFESQPGGVFADYEEVCSILKKQENFSELLVMEFLPGQEYSVDILADNGEAQIIIPRTRDKIILGASFSGRTVNSAEIINISRKIVEGLGLDGVVGVQYRRDVNGALKVLEVNPRVHGAVVLSFASGANIVKLSLKNILNIKWKKPKIKWGTKLSRYYSEVYIDEKGKFFKI